MSKIVEVPFYGDAVQAVHEGAAVHVVVKRVCEALGLDHSAQLERLKRKPWACVAMMAIQLPGDQTREIACLDLDSLPMWLATIDAGRVKPEVRFKLIAYQKECARVLRDHFFGQRAQSEPQPLDMQALVGAILAQVLAAVDARFDAKLGALSLGVVRPWELGAVKRRLSAAADLAVIAKAYPSRKSALAGLTMRVRTACGWTGTGAHLNRMPAPMLPYAERELSCIEREFERAGNVRQLPLARVEP